MKVLLTGGLGFIGSHTAVALAAAGHEPVLFDNLSNSSPTVVKRVSQITGRSVSCVIADVRDASAVRKAMDDERVEAVVHFAALKAVAESVSSPLSYHANNVGGLLSLLEAMDDVGVRDIVFSSSATVYGEPHELPIDENHPTSAVNPYGRTKLICEQILSDLTRGSGEWRVSLLRYFNPVGGHPSGLIGESPLGKPNNLMPLLVRAAQKTGSGAHLSVFGTDYPTTDGSAVRDYVHVVDLAEGHVAALDRLATGDALQIYNLGTGRGTSVLELLAAFEKANNVAVPHVSAPRRDGDVAAMFASVDKAQRELGWRAQRGIEEMCLDSWLFATKSHSDLGGALPV
ncbi:UDP-glucose 4-epimerase GalE [Sphingomonas edaphi]|uniref:UDP-glucose 4-epimerase n=1 Tax=Sphingomonas edaphi TaxID=2315689 RepID=A0A418PYH6_9SPHN|nr:UDP-glucose 4-epimerase GalE [Sphingomonas edaphi]RIX27022.1 UDP-glucose 4-epimerase GalE [Sphingomonas edaphi]